MPETRILGYLASSLARYRPAVSLSSISQVAGIRAGLPRDQLRSMVEPMFHSNSNTGGCLIFVT